MKERNSSSKYVVGRSSVVVQVCFAQFDVGLVLRTASWFRYRFCYMKFTMIQETEGCTCGSHKMCNGNPVDLR